MLGEVRGKHWGLGRRNLAAAAGMFGINETLYRDVTFTTDYKRQRRAHTTPTHGTSNHTKYQNKDHQHDAVPQRPPSQQRSILICTEVYHSFYAQGLSLLQSRDGSDFSKDIVITPVLLRVEIHLQPMHGGLRQRLIVVMRSAAINETSVN